ncbi:zinc-binding dehydrogenase [Chloroflexota bacterium]
MKAVVISKRDDLSVKDVPVPKIERDEVLVRHKASGICHSDYLLISGQYILPFEYPVTPGHEWAGEIVEVGSEVKVFKVGDRVTGECVFGCGVCELCQSGNFTYCPSAGHFGFTAGTRGGADQEYFAVSERLLHKFPEGVSFEKGSLLEPFTVAYYAFEATAKVDASDIVLISGGGNIGLCALAVAKGKGARAIVLEPVPLRQKVAKEMGADFVLDPSEEDIIEKVKDLTNEHGADFVLETSGESASYKNMFDYVRNNGSIAVVGINIGNVISAELGKIQSKGLNIRGTVGSPYVWEKALKFLAQSKVDITKIQTHKFPLEKAEEAFKIAKDREKAIKAVLISE